MFKWTIGILYVISIIAANFCVSYFGIVNYFGLVFPAGAIFVGLTFSLRDIVQREWGDWNVWYFMLVSAFLTTITGMMLSHLPIPLWKVAVASCVAFMVSEAVDWLVFTFLKWDIVKRIMISNLFSTPIDSILFVGIAFGSFSFIAPPVYGQAIVKYVSGLLIIPIILYVRHRSASKKILVTY